MLEPLPWVVSGNAQHRHLRYRMNKCGEDERSLSEMLRMGLESSLSELTLIYLSKERRRSLPVYLDVAKYGRLWQL